MGPPLPTLFPGRRGMGEEHRLWERQQWWTARERGGWTGGEGGGVPAPASQSTLGKILLAS